MKLFALAILGLLFIAEPSLAADAEGGGDMAWNFFLRVMNYVPFIVVVILLVRKPLKKALGARREGIKEQMAELEAKREEAAKVKAEAIDALARMEQESAELLKEYQRQAELERERIIVAAKEQAERIKKQAELSIAREFEQAKQLLQKELALAAAQLAENTLRQQINEDDQNKLNENFLHSIDNYEKVVQ